MATNEENHSSYPEQVSNTSCGMPPPSEPQNTGVHGHDINANSANDLFLLESPMCPGSQLEDSFDSMMPSSSFDDHLDFHLNLLVPEGSRQQLDPEMHTTISQSELTLGDLPSRNPALTVNYSVNPINNRIRALEQSSEAQLAGARNKVKDILSVGTFNEKDLFDDCNEYSRLQYLLEKLKLNVDQGPEPITKKLQTKRRNKICANASNRKRIALQQFFKAITTQFVQESKKLVNENQRMHAEIKRLRDENRRLRGRSLPDRSSGSSPPDDPPDDDPAGGNPGCGNPGRGGSSSHGTSRGGSGGTSFPGGSSAGSQAPADTLSVTEASSNQACASTAISDTVYLVREDLSDRRLLPGAGAQSNQICSPSSKNCDTADRVAEGGSDEYSRSGGPSSDNLPSSDDAIVIRSTTDSKNCDTADRVAEVGSDKHSRSGGPSSDNLHSSDASSAIILPSKQECTSDSKNCDMADRVAEGGSEKHSRSGDPSSDNPYSSYVSSGIILLLNQECTSDSKNCDTADRVAEGGSEKHSRSSGPSSDNLPNFSLKNAYNLRSPMEVPMTPTQELSLSVANVIGAPSVSHRTKKYVGVPNLKQLRRMKRRK